VRPDLRGFNVYIIVDPANEKKKTNDYTVMVVLALGSDNNYYLIDAVRDRLNLTQRTEKLFSLVRRYRPIKVVYEQYGMQADIQHIKYVQSQRNYRFSVGEIGGVTPKPDRIRWLIPPFEQSRFYLPRVLMYVDHQGQQHDFVRELIEDEFKTFPVCAHDDMLDCVSRVMQDEFGAVFPSEAETRSRTGDDNFVEEKRKTPYFAKHEFDVLAA
jgi:predicted phage terminase large subunit-like protein